MSIVEDSDLWRHADRLTIVGMAALSVDGKVTRCTKRFAELLGRDRLKVEKRNIAEFSEAREREVTRQRFADFASGEETRTKSQKKYVKPDGSTVFCEFEAIRMDGRPPYLLSFVTPIDSTRVEMEHRLEEMQTLISLLTSSMAGGVTFNVSGHHQSADRGGQNHYTGGDRNSTKPFRWFAAAIIAIATTLAWIAYYQAGGVGNSPNFNPLPSSSSQQPTPEKGPEP